MEKSAAVGVWDKLVRQMLFRWFHHQMIAILSLESGFNVLIYFYTQSKVFSPIVETLQACTGINAGFDMASRPCYKSN